MSALMLLLGISLLGIGGIIVVLWYTRSAADYANPDPQNDELLSDRLLQIDALRQEGLRLRDELQRQNTQLTAELRSEIFQELQPLLTNYPSILQMVQLKPDLPAKNLTSLFTSLDNLLASWNYKPIGSAWEQVPYNPQLHEPDGDIQAGELVYVRFVGYWDGDRILCPAKVSRTLPGGAK